MSIKNLFISCISLNLFAYLTIRLRPYIYKVKLFKPMIWNFKLSLLPFLIQFINIILILVIAQLVNVTQFGWLIPVAYIVFIVMQLIWLAYLPNSSYLITELNLTHREMDENEVPIWYDIVSVLSFALSGIVNTLANIVIIQFEALVLLDPNALSKSHSVNLWLSTIALTILVTIGIYLGRSIRFNTWDLLHPISFVKKLINHFKKPREIKNFILFVSLHSILFIILYVLFGVSDFFSFI